MFAIMCLEACSLLLKGTCILNSTHILGAGVEGIFVVLVNACYHLLKPDNGFVDLCHSLADSTLLEFLCEYLSEGLPLGML
jgi:hypothetical protein